MKCEHYTEYSATLPQPTLYATSNSATTVSPRPTAPLASASASLVLASLPDPVEVRLASEHTSQATFEVLHPLSKVPATESKALAYAYDFRLILQIKSKRHLEVLKSSLVFGRRSVFFYERIFRRMPSAMLTKGSIRINEHAAVETAHTAGG